MLKSYLNRSNWSTSGAANWTGGLAGLGAALLLAALLAWVEPEAGRYDSWAPLDYPQIADDSGRLIPVGRPWWDVPHRTQLTRYDVGVELTRAQLAERSPALRLSGTFSARILLNGRPIGAKGRPAANRQAERAGPIDVLIPLGDAAHAGINRLTIVTSAHRAGYRPPRMFNELAIRDYREDGRRSLDLYRMAMVQVGLIGALALLVFGMQIGRRDKAWPVHLIGFSCLFLLSAFLGEIARALVSYPYSWHIVRQLWIWLSAIGFGCMLTLYLARLSPRLGWRWLAIGWAAILVVGLAFPMPDVRTAGTVAGMIVLAAILALRRDGWAPHAFAAACLPLVVLLYVDPGRSLDNALYLLIAPPLLVLSVEAFAATSRPSGAPEAIDLPGNRIDFGLASGPTEVSTIRRIEAAGNYAEVWLKDGDHHLVRMSLSQIDARAGPDLLRVHRSHLVNSDCFRAVRCEIGSRYFLQLDEGAVALSRRMVDVVRKRVASTAASHRRRSRGR